MSSVAGAQGAPPRLRDLDEIRSYLRADTSPVYFVSATPFNFGLNFKYVS